MKLMHNGLVVGELDGRTLTKRGKQVQLFRMYNGFAVSVSLLDQVDTVIVHYQGRAYKATAQRFREQGIPHRYKFDDQLVLPRPFWDEVETKQERLF